MFRRDQNLPYCVVVRVGIFTDTYIPEVNGVVTVISMMSRELQKLGHEVLTFCPRYAVSSPADENVYRFRSVPFAFYQGMRVALPYSRRAARILPTLDVIHSHDPFSMGLLALWASRRFGIPHVHTYHDLYMEYRRYLPLGLRPSPAMIKWMSRKFTDRCEAVIAPSEQMRSEIASYGVRAALHVLPFGMDEADFDREIRWDARRALGLPTEELLLYAGRVGKEKNLEFLLRSFQRVAGARPAARLIIAGDGPYRPAVEEYAERLGLAGRVLFTGFLARHDLVDLYKQAAVFVFASKTETQGLVVMEAMMAGTAVVAVNVMGPVDVIENGRTGLLVDEREEEFAAACLKLLGDERGRTAMGVAARTWAQSRSSSASVAQLLDIYRSAVR
jgi:glycosyltransferase involved in cell wall biosynthesis